MTWSEFMMARQLLAEERVGTRAREAVRAEDEIVAQSMAGLRRDADGTR